MTHLTTHVLNATTGRPAVGVPVTLSDAGGETVAVAMTDGDGRVGDLYTDAATGVYHLAFDTATYFAAEGITGFYPEIVITFEIADADSKYHVPLLLSPFAYSTYRGS
jgi:5-hydroxyisourate hydrolase